ncbi:MAG: ASKHA domain-containing protein [Spirochaetaceae bacterium]|jgi:uncharacterized 2Fe-2S/4Fe-4S cluster protein (DUF4445 family)|nr:ASKHA domain-containing protein [Spirochaetaceae bacterium]
MIEITLIAEGKEPQKIAAEPAFNLLKTLQNAGVYFPAVCGGRGVCGKCRVKAVSGSLPISSADQGCFSAEALSEGWRLACAAFPGSPLTLVIPETGEQRFSGVADFQFEPVVRALEESRFTPEKSSRSFARQIKPEGGLTLSELREVSKLAEAPKGEPVSRYYQKGRLVHIGTEPLYGIAVDIGTTTIAFAAADLKTGSVSRRLSMVNRQREYGADVISRIQRANGGDLARLSRCVREQVAEGIAALRAGLEEGVMRSIAVAGNTTMIHLLLQLSCNTLGTSPFTPVTADMTSMRYRELFDGDLDCEVVVLPGISAYIGADITAGILFTELHNRAVPAAFMDIGTNGEMTLAWDGKLLCAATAAGPAFEGGNILWGTGSVPGAIARARFLRGVFEVETIGKTPPIGVCGSGAVDAVSQGLAYGLILPSGKLQTSDIVLAKHPDGRDIVFTQKDIRELQLAKSAVRSGFDALLNHAGLGYGDIHTLYLAGGFGFHLNLESAAEIGLIPKPLISKTRLIGNSALGGAAAYLLNPRYESALAQITKQAEELALPTDPYFNAHFIDNLSFEDTPDR